ncbi:hypothetical protein B0H11DRAFT_111539 [Mycena galericulata]|nr:hypothetical protein B0H11DRAFT_111539 [Mycena galericulata]
MDHMYVSIAPVLSLLRYRAAQNPRLLRLTIWPSALARSDADREQERVSGQLVPCDSRTNIVVRCGIHRTRCYGHPDVVQAVQAQLGKPCPLCIAELGRRYPGTTNPIVPSRKCCGCPSPLPGCVPVRSHSASQYTRARHRRLIRTVFRPDAVCGPHTGRLHWICTRGRAALAVRMGRTHGALIG